MTPQIVTVGGWYALALAKKAHAPRMDLPEVGYYKRRYVRGGPWVPARIWIVEYRDPETNELMSDQKYFCEVGGAAKDPFNQWPSLLGHPIPKHEFDFLTARREWAIENKPNHPQASPRERIDPRTAPPVF
jgi:hypothetical protein